MFTFKRRRYRNSIITLIALACTYLLLKKQEASLHVAAYTSGYVLLSSILFLAAFHWRKKIAFIPIGSATLWMQSHIYVGLFSMPLFLMHIGCRIPNGRFEIMLAIMYTATAVSGIFGLYVTRTFPRRLTNSSEEYLFERIPAYRRELQHATRQLIKASVSTEGGTPLADFYRTRLGAYFEQTRGLWFHLRPMTKERRKVMTELSSLQRYLSENERSVSDQLFRLIRKKDDLDYQFALQMVLKSWLVVHLALTYSLILFAAVHTVLVHGFRGGWH